MLVEITGIDGSGKTTLIHRLRKELNEHSHIWAYERNFKNRSKRFLESIALNKGFDRCEKLFKPELVEFANALELVEEVNRNFYYLRDDSRQVYFVDQYYCSWMATAILNELDILEDLRMIYSYLPKPDLSIFLTVPPEIALSRLQAREKGDQILQLDSPINRLSNMAKIMDEVHKEELYPQIKIDGSKGPDAIYDEVITLLMQRRKWEFR
ncbi:AAA family ATPase [Brevibacillus centrosporus]|uniref:Thymidylate kinase n=1 Tax=Brevibacillus centrosporus TaxID=54910 RepID=A0A1I4E2F1_9BACL|nr:AAA family ATPase [Brevibacillus centrosporus]SFL00038.1 thymidylate kinase [Brevibacillus centrosporus]